MIVGGIALNVLLKLGLVLAIGLVGGRVAREFKLPNVSGYLVAGLFLGPSFTGLITAQDLDALTVISEVALAIIAFSIGSEFVLADLRKLGKSIVIITLLEVVGAIGIVFGRQLVELSERKAHGSLIQCKGAKPNHCSGRSHELRSLYQKKKKRKTPGLRGTARVGMVG